MKAKPIYNNRRSSRIVEFKGVKRTLAQWRDFLGIKGSTLRQRYYVYKWPLEKVFSTGKESNWLT